MRYGWRLWNEFVQVIDYTRTMSSPAFDARHLSLLEQSTLSDAFEDSGGVRSSVDLTTMTRFPVVVKVNIFHKEYHSGCMRRLTRSRTNVPVTTTQARSPTCICW